MIGHWNISCFAMNTSRRGMTAPSSGGSALLKWFDATMSGPLRGIVLFAGDSDARKTKIYGLDYSQERPVEQAG